MKKYLRVAKYCGDNNGVSICMLPQIGAVGINGLIDLNGKKGPNIFGRDLRFFSLPVKTRIGFSKETEDVIFLDEDPIRPDEDCEGLTCGCGTLPPCEPFRLLLVRMIQKG